MSAIRIKLYTRPGCELCEQAKELLDKLAADHPHELVEIDIERDPALLARFLERIPVLEVGPYTLEAPIEELNLKVALQAAGDSASRQMPEASPVTRGQAVFLNKLLYTITRRWLLIFNLVVLLYVGLPFLAPVLLRAGVERPARWIYSIYSPLCHQLPYRSWFLFGEEPAYPLELAGLEGTTFEEISAIPPGDLRVVRRYTGEAGVGYKVALCERDVAIYGSILLGGLLFGLLRHRLKPMSIWLWFLVGIVPIAVDGTSQLLSVFPLFSFGMRESTPLLRTLTGMLFGLSNVWLAYPYVEEAMQETRTLVAAKLAASEELG